MSVYLLPTSFLDFDIIVWFFFVFVRFPKEIQGNNPYKVYSVKVQPNPLFFMFSSYNAFIYLV